MSKLTRIVFVLAACSWTTACDDASDGNSNPQSASCSTRAVMHCRNGSGCHEFYSDEAADAVRSTCVSLGDVIGTGSCAESFDRCCIHLDGSFDYPEGICLSPSSSTYSNLSGLCDDPDPYCVR